MFDVREAPDVKEEPKTAKLKNPRIKGVSKTGERDRQIKSKGLKFKCSLSKKGISPFDEIEWERRNASISDSKGASVFAQNDVEAPKFWSMLATNVVASKYFYGGIGTEEREFSVRQLIHRVTRTIADWGLNAGYFAEV